LAPVEDKTMTTSALNLFGGFLVLIIAALQACGASDEGSIPEDGIFSEPAGKDDTGGAPTPGGDDNEMDAASGDDDAADDDDASDDDSTTGDDDTTVSDDVTSAAEVCFSDTDCNELEKTKCEIVSGLCVQCLVDEDCPDGNACDPVAYVCLAPIGECSPCSVDADCPPETGLFCSDPAGGVCQRTCVSDLDCLTQAAPACVLGYCKCAN
jgi:hypothetical protein